MRAVSRRGWTLLELLIVLVLTIILAALVGSVIAAIARSATRQARALNLERTQVALAAWWRADFRDGDAGDVVVPTNNQIVTRHPVGAGVPCQSVGTDLWIARTDWRGARDPESGRDEAWLLTDVLTAAWSDVAIVAVGSGSCPSGEPALRLTLGAAILPVQLARVVEPVELRIYRSGPSGWLGLAPADGSASVQPFAGPVDPVASGFSQDSSGVQALIQHRSGQRFRLNAPLMWP